MRMSRVQFLSLAPDVIQVGFPSGQREQTVNLSAKPSEVQILPPPPTLESESYVGDSVGVTGSLLYYMAFSWSVAPRYFEKK